MKIYFIYTSHYDEMGPYELYTKLSDVYRVMPRLEHEWGVVRMLVFDTSKRDDHGAMKYIDSFATRDEIMWGKVPEGKVNEM